MPSMLGPLRRSPVALAVLACGIVVVLVAQAAMPLVRAGPEPPFLCVVLDRSGSVVGSDLVPDPADAQQRAVRLVERLGAVAGPAKVMVIVFGTGVQRATWGDAGRLVLPSTAVLGLWSNLAGGLAACLMTPASLILVASDGAGEGKGPLETPRQAAVLAAMEPQLSGKVLLLALLPGPASATRSALEHLVQISGGSVLPLDAEADLDAAAAAVLARLPVPPAPATPTPEPASPPESTPAPIESASPVPGPPTPALPTPAPTSVHQQIVAPPQRTSFPWQMIALGIGGALTMAALAVPVRRRAGRRIRRTRGKAAHRAQDAGAPAAETRPDGERVYIANRTTGAGRPVRLGETPVHLDARSLAPAAAAGPSTVSLLPGRRFRVGQLGAPQPITAVLNCPPFEIRLLNA